MNEQEAGTLNLWLRRRPILSRFGSKDQERVWPGGGGGYTQNEDAKEKLKPSLFDKFPDETILEGGPSDSSNAGEQPF